MTATTEESEDRMDRIDAAREILAGCMDLPMLLEGIGDEDDLTASGLGSAELLLIALRCEELLGRPLGDGELSELTTVTAIADLMAAGPAAKEERL